MDIREFPLNSEDMAETARPDIDHGEIVRHYDPAFVKILHTMKLHH